MNVKGGSSLARGLTAHEGSSASNAVESEAAVDWAKTLRAVARRTNTEAGRIHIFNRLPRKILTRQSVYYPPTHNM